jgi:peptidoglycan hydrolase-like protein with peptidoglycan-binding domain
MSALLGAVVMLSAACGTSSLFYSTTTRPVSSTVTTSTLRPATTTTTVALPPTSSTTTTTTLSLPTARLALGDRGTEVGALQRRLSSLGYWLGPDDGYFGDSTQQAVYALQKAAGIERDGIVGPVTEAALVRGVVPHPAGASGYVVEVDLHDDLLMIVDKGRLLTVLNTSTGGGYIYVDQGVTAVALTPVGVFHVYGETDGLVTDSLGQLWRPKYFDSGFAIHGDSYVPRFQSLTGACVSAMRPSTGSGWTT